MYEVTELTWDYSVLEWQSQVESNPCLRREIPEKTLTISETCPKTLTISIHVGSSKSLVVPHDPEKCWQNVSKFPGPDPVLRGRGAQDLGNGVPLGESAAPRLNPLQDLGSRDLLAKLPKGRYRVGLLLLPPKKRTITLGIDLLPTSATIALLPTDFTRQNVQ